MAANKGTAAAPKAASSTKAEPKPAAAPKPAATPSTSRMAEAAPAPATVTRLKAWPKSVKPEKGGK